MLTAFTARPFLKAVLGGAVGMATVLLLALTLYAGGTLYKDHQLLQAVVAALNNMAKQQAPPPR